MRHVTEDGLPVKTTGLQQQRPKIFAINHLTGPGLCAGHGENGGIEVHAHDRFAAEASRLDLAGPSHHHGHAHAALVDGALARAQRVVVGRSPLLRADAVVFVAAVVGEEHDDGVVNETEFFERVEQAADVLVHAVNLRRIERHAVRHLLPPLRGHVVPRRHVLIARTQPPGTQSQARLALPRQAFGAQRVPAGRVTVAIFLHVFGQRVQRPVRRVVGEIEE